MRAIWIVLVTVPLLAQWPKVKTKGVPLTKDGKPNLTAPAPKLANGKPNFSGVWESIKVPCGADPLECSDAPEGIPLGFIDASATKPEEAERGRPGGLPYTPWALEKLKQVTEADSPRTRCLPFSAIEHWWTFHPTKILQTEEAIVLLNEYMAQFRQIFLDGRPVPKDPFPNFKGYSVGHWEGSTLVVETTGYKDGLWLDAKGNPLTEQGRTIERIRRPDYGHLQVQITIDDPKAYTKPWAITRNMNIVVNTELIDYICNENEKDRGHMQSLTPTEQPQR